MEGDEGMQLEEPAACSPRGGIWIFLSVHCEREEKVGILILEIHPKEVIV